jgi:hypothetical protein
VSAGDLSALGAFNDDLVFGWIDRQDAGHYLVGYNGGRQSLSR